MKKNIYCEKGMTLVELLAVLAISSTIILIIISVHVLIQKQYTEQSTQAQNLFDVSYALKDITKEIRMADKDEIEKVLTMYKYNSENQTIEKNGIPIAKNIAEFHMELQGNHVMLKIINLTNNKVETELVLREGDYIE